MMRSRNGHYASQYCIHRPQLAPDNDPCSRDTTFGVVVKFDQRYEACHHAHDGVVAVPIDRSDRTVYSFSIHMRLKRPKTQSDSVIGCVPENASTLR